MKAQATDTVVDQDVFVVPDIPIKELLDVIPYVFAVVVVSAYQRSPQGPLFQAFSIQVFSVHVCFSFCF